MEEGAGAADESEQVEVGVAYDGLEAFVWVRQLEGLGIQAETRRRGGWLKAILYLGRRPVAVRVAKKDLARAREHLRKFRFIEA